jgi:hypothetical protein
MLPRVVYCCVATSVLRLGSAHFGSTLHGKEKHNWREVVYRAQIHNNIIHLSVIVTSGYDESSLDAVKIKVMTGS